MTRLVVVILVVLLTLANLALAEPGPNPVRLPRTAPPPASTGVTVVVLRGDHLWKISERHLNSLLGREATDDEVSPYWRQVIGANREGLRSGDPDLIYPGEVVTLPEVDISAGR
jgi:nucleoid-associated protein YgaU